MYCIDVSCPIVYGKQSVMSTKVFLGKYILCSTKMLLAWNTELEARTIVSFLFMRLCLNSTLRSEMSEADFSMCLFYIRLGTRFCLGTVTQGWTIFYLVKRADILCQQNCSKNQNSACDQSSWGWPSKVLPSKGITMFGVQLN